MSILDCQYLYPNLIKIFGLKCVRQASVHNMPKLRFLESSLILLSQNIEVSLKWFSAVKDPTELF